MVAGPPRSPVAIPAELARFGDLEAVWLNELGGLTFRGAGLFVKWLPGHDFGAEAERMTWASRWHPVPEVLEVGEGYLVTRAIAAVAAVDVPAAVGARAIGAGLRRLHDALPTEECPWSWSVEERGGRGAPPIDRLVVCSGDPCAPNTLVDARGRFAASVDLGRLGLADRWADLAVASMSLAWNFEEPAESEFWAGYGIEPDAERVEFYRELWNAP